MKRKFLSTLLFGALACATLGTVTSCKDYDDDISNLQNQIDKLVTADQLTSKVNELQSLISANSSDINTLKSELAKKTTLDEVKALLADYATKKYVDDADATLEAAIKAIQTKDISDLKALVEKAQATADEAKANAEAGKAEIIETLKEYAKNSDLDEAKKAAQEAIEALQASNAQALADAVKDLNAAIKEAKDAAKIADDKAVDNAAAIEALGETVTKAAHADSLAAANKADIEKALKLLGDGFSEQNTIAAAINAINGQLESKTSGLSALDSRLSAIETVLDGVKDDDTKLGLSDKVTKIEGDLTDIIGEYTTMVTSVDTYKYFGADKTLNFVYLASEKTTKFPLKEDVADKQIKFSEENKNITTQDSLVIRVSPTNATLAAANVSLLNSQGKDLSEFVEVADVKPYTKLSAGSTRAAEGAGNGLWLVKFKVKDNIDVTADDFQKAIATEYGKVNFAVAVKNTKNAADTRRVISEYEVNVAPSEFENAQNDMNINNTAIAATRNRLHWVGSDAYIWADQKQEAGSTESVWKNGTPQIAENINDDNVVLASESQDGRYNQSYVKTSVGKNIDIEIANANSIKGFYVTLDNANAIESAPSELQAWASYSYKNVGVTTANGTVKQKAHMFDGAKGSIAVTSLNGDVKGDKIGFRVYVVQLDGTLVDPDGRAFYIQIGDEKQNDVDVVGSAISASAEKAGDDFTSDFIAVNKDAFADAANLSSLVWKVTVNPGNKKDALSGTPYTGSVTDAQVEAAKPTFTFYKEDKKTVTTNPADIAYVKATIAHANLQKYVDNETYTFKATLKGSDDFDLRDVTVSVTKAMPKTAPALAYKDDINPDEQILANTTGTEIYKLGNSTVQGTTMESMMKNINSNYTLYFADVEKSHNVPDTKIMKVSGPTFALGLIAGDIDGKNHAISYDYNYGAISLKLEGKEFKSGNHVLENQTAEDLYFPFKSWIDCESFAWKSSKQFPVLTNGKEDASKNTTANVVNFVSDGTGGGDIETSEIMCANSAVFQGTFGRAARGEYVAMSTLNDYVKVVTGETGNNAYLNPTIVGSSVFTVAYAANKFIVTQSNAAVNPGTKATLRFYVKDCFGHNVKVELPLTIKKD